MTTTTAAGQRFALDETRAAEWVREAIEWDGDVADMPSVSLSAGWDATEPGEEGTVWRLVRYAVEEGVITAPDGMDLDFEYIADEDGGMYHFPVTISTRLAVSSHGYEMRKLGERDARGAEAALAILREAVGTANSTLTHLGEYVASRQDNTLADERTAHGEPLPGTPED